MRADLAEWKRLGLLSVNPLEKAVMRPELVRRMQYWQADRDFDGVRGDALAKLPRTGQHAWQQLWADVAATLESAKYPPRVANESNWKRAEQLLKAAAGGVSQKTLHGSLTDQARQQTHDQPMEPGKAYIIELRSSAFDTFLKVVDGMGKLVAWNDDIEENLNSGIVFIPLEPATYRIVATSFENRGRGAYALTVTSLSARKGN